MYSYCMNQVVRQDAEIGEYECEAILDFKIMEGKRRYLIKWIGFPARFNTWEPLRNLFAISDQLLKFQKKQRSLVKEKENQWSSLYLAGQVNQPLDYSEIPVIKKEADRIKRAQAWFQEQSLLNSKSKEQSLKNKSKLSKPIKKRVFSKKEAAVKKKKRKTSKKLGRPRKQKVEEKSDDLNIPEEDPQFYEEEQEEEEEEQMKDENLQELEEKIKPAFEEELVRVQEDELAPALEDELAPVFEDEIAPAFEEELAPAVEDELAPAVEDELAPAVSLSSELYPEKDLSQMEERKEDGDIQDKFAEENNVKVKVEDPVEEVDCQEIDDQEEERASSSRENRCDHCAFSQQSGNKPVKMEQSQQQIPLQLPTAQKKNGLEQNENEDRHPEQNIQGNKQVLSCKPLKENSVNLGEVLKGIISLNEVKGQKPTLSRVEQIHVVHGERICEVEAVEKNGAFVRRFISYQLLREYYSKPLLIFLEKSGRIVI